MGAVPRRHRFAVVRCSGEDTSGSAGECQTRPGWYFFLIRWVVCSVDFRIADGRRTYKVSLLYFLDRSRPTNSIGGCNKVGWWHLSGISCAGMSESRYYMFVIISLRRNLIEVSPLTQKLYLFVPPRACGYSLGQWVCASTMVIVIVAG